MVVKTQHEKDFISARKIEKWRARITLSGKQLALGYFSTPEEAACAYDAAAIEQWGEFAYTNFPLEGTICRLA